MKTLLKLLCVLTASALCAFLIVSAHIERAPAQKPKVVAWTPRNQSLKSGSLSTGRLDS